MLARRLGLIVLAVGASGGFRQGLDADVMWTTAGRDATSAGMWDHSSGLVFGPAMFTGFGRYPTDLAAEIGYGADTTLAAIDAVVGRRFASSRRMAPVRD